MCGKCWTTQYIAAASVLAVDCMIINILILKQLLKGCEKKSPVRSIASKAVEDCFFLSCLLSSFAATVKNTIKRRTPRKGLID